MNTELQVANLKTKIEAERISGKDWIERDIERCRHIFLENIEPDEVCLCRGLAGNYLVLGQYLQWRYNLGLMTGISGIGLALLQKTPDLGLLG